MSRGASHVPLCPVTWDPVMGPPALPSAPTGIRGLVRWGAEPSPHPPAIGALVLGM